MKDEDVELGQHCWAVSNGKLLVVLKTQTQGYEVCGAWECGIAVEELDLISIIEKPPGYATSVLYYDY